jgi:hypothetical protein
MKSISAITILILLTAVLAYGGFHLKRTINYNWYYKDAVKETIRQEIKPLQDQINKLQSEIITLKTNR